MQATEIAPGHKHPVMVKQPCGFCGNNPPYMCGPCNTNVVDHPADLREEHAGRRSVVGTVAPDYWFV